MPRRRDPNEFRKTGTVYIVKVIATDKETGEVTCSYEGSDKKSFSHVNWHNLVCYSWNNRYFAIKRIPHIDNFYHCGWNSRANKVNYTYELLTYDKLSNVGHTKFSFVERESISTDYNYYTDPKYLEKRN